jgi:hypothetical protein
MKQLTRHVEIELERRGSHHGLVTTTDGLVVDYVRRAADEGMPKDDAVAKLTKMTDRYPMDVEQDGMAPMVMKMNVANLYDYVTGAGIHRRS